MVAFMTKYILAFCAIIFVCASPYQSPKRQMEYLDRGLVAIPDGKGKVLVSWRWLVEDAENTHFEIYRRENGGPAKKVNDGIILKKTNWTDENVDSTKTYTYELSVSRMKSTSVNRDIYTLKAFSKPYLSISLQTPAGYAPNDASVGDLDGDGAYEIILHQSGRGRDNSQAGVTDPPVIQAYKLDGTMLWQINLGKNIREGAHYTQFMVYDLDGDGRAEVAMKTADGSIDGKGKVIGDSTKDYRNERGYVLAASILRTVIPMKYGKAWVLRSNLLPTRFNNWKRPAS